MVLKWCSAPIPFPAPRRSLPPRFRRSHEAYRQRALSNRTPPLNRRLEFPYPCCSVWPRCFGALASWPCAPRARRKRRSTPPRSRPGSRPVIGAVIVASLATFTPQVLGAGRGALALNIATAFPSRPCWLSWSSKSIACLISLAAGFRGGLFFASLAHGRAPGQDLCLWSPRACPAARARSDHLHPRGDGDDGRRDRRRPADHVFPGSRKHRRFFRDRGAFSRRPSPPA